MKKTTLGVLLGLVVSICQAALIVDTGPGPSTLGSGFNLGTQSWAGEFSVGSSVTVTQVEGWISSIQVTGGPGLPLTAQIRADAGDIPGAVLFGASFTGPGSGEVGWFGPSGLDWDLNPGTYWVAFVVLPGQGFAGNMPGPSATPLGNEAVGNIPIAGAWTPVDSLNVGVRINADPQSVPSVPEPGTLARISLALVGLGFSRRRKLH